MSDLWITPGGNPVCSKCGNWYGPGARDTHPCVDDDPGDTGTKNGDNPNE